MHYNDFLPNYGDVLLPEDLQVILHLGRNTMYKYLKNGTIKSIVVGGKYKIPKYYLYKYLYPDTNSSKGA